MRLVNADTVADDLKDLIKSGMYPSIIAEKFVPLVHAIQMLPRIEAEPVRYCRECKWSWCQIFVDKYGKNKTYWKCLNWDGETDEEGYCHKWEAKMEELE